MAGLTAFRQVFSNRNYRLYLLGNLCSSSGNWVQRVGMSWLTWDITHSAAWLGVMAFADLFPTFAIGLIAGTLVDRSDSMKVLRATQLLAFGQAAGLTALAVTGHATVWWLLVFALLRGTINAFNRPARLTTVYYIAGREYLSSAIAINAMVFNSSRFIGPALGGAITATWGVGWAFAYNALSYLVFFIALLAIRVSSAGVERKTRGTVFGESWEGVRYVFNQPGILFLVIVMTANALFVRPFIELLPGFADRVFGRGVDAYSTMLALHGIGAMAGGYWLASRGGVAGFTRFLVWSLLAIAISLLIFTGIGNYWVALPILVVTGVAFVIQGVAIQTMMQTSAEPEMRGRIMGIYGMMARGGPAAGALVMGSLSEYFGLSAPVAGGAVLCLLLWLWARTRQKSMSAELERDPEESPSMAERRHEAG